VIEWPSLAERVQLAAQRALGETVLFWPVEAPPYEYVEAIVYEEFDHVTLDDGVPVTTKRKMLAVHLADFTIREPAQGDSFQIGIGVFQVIDVQPDGEGDAHVFVRPAFG